jgi:hypothetical protein
LIQKEQKKKKNAHTFFFQSQRDTEEVTPSIRNKAATFETLCDKYLYHICEDELPTSEVSTIMLALSYLLDCNKEKVKQYCQRLSLDVARAPIPQPPIPASETVARAKDGSDVVQSQSSNLYEVRSASAAVNRLVVSQDVNANDLIATFTATLEPESTFSLDSLAFTHRRSVFFCQTPSASFYIDTRTPTETAK